MCIGNLDPKPGANCAILFLYMFSGVGTRRPVQRALSRRSDLPFAEGPLWFHHCIGVGAVSELAAKADQGQSQDSQKSVESRSKIDQDSRKPAKNQPKIDRKSIENRTRHWITAAVFGRIPGQPVA